MRVPIIVQYSLASIATWLCYAHLQTLLGIDAAWHMGCQFADFSAWTATWHLRCPF